MAGNIKFSNIVNVFFLFFLDKVTKDKRLFSQLFIVSQLTNMRHFNSVTEDSVAKTILELISLIRFCEWVQIVRF